MNRKKGKGFKKMMGIAVLSIGLFSAGFVGVNHLAFAATTGSTESMPLVMESVSIPTVSALPESNVGAFTASRSITSRETSHRQLSIEFGNWIPGTTGMAFGAPTVNCISIVEAAEISADALEQLFGANLEESTFFMTYWGGGEGYANWNGQIFPGNEFSHEVMPQFSFTVNASTGELMDASYNPFAVEAFINGVRGRTAIVPNIEAMGLLRTLSAQDNYEIAMRAMGIAQDSTLFEGEVARARIDSYVPDFAIPSGEPMLRIFVIVQCENCESVRFSFQEMLEEEALLHLVVGRAETTRSMAASEELLRQFGVEPVDSAFDWVNR
ncbi:MAG: hypothetical protein FWF81_04205 [Defluviitaleaceae bacterium]|nr:hypothetical protein [Defluviitaleaceae bacterium]